MVREDPKFTLILLSYNQARFLPEALEGAFAQDFEPLEILISDDCSSDGSQEIIARAVANYRGRHLIRVNFNAENLGIVRHVNLVFKLAQGRFVVAAASDDVSLPNRVRRIAEAMMQTTAEPVLATVSDAIAINENGAELGYIRTCEDPRSLTAISLAREGGYVTGAAAAYARSLIVDLTELDPRACAEDSILPFRAALLGCVEYIPEALVKRRIHDASITGAENKDPQVLLRAMRPMQYAFEARLADLEHPLVAAKIDEFTRKELGFLIALSIGHLRLSIAHVERRKGALLQTLKSVLAGRIGVLRAIRMLLVLRMAIVWKAYMSTAAFLRRLDPRVRARDLTDRAAR